MKNREDLIIASISNIRYYCNKYFTNEEVGEDEVIEVIRRNLSAVDDFDKAIKEAEAKLSVDN